MLKLPFRWISLWQAAWSWQSRVDTARSQWAVTGRWIEALLEPRWCPARRGRGSARGAFPSHLCLSLEPPAARPADSAIDNPLVPHERRRPGGGAPLDDPSCTDSACCLSFSTVVRFCSMFAACLLTREEDTRCSRQSLQADDFFHEFAGSGFRNRGRRNSATAAIDAEVRGTPKTVTLCQQTVSEFSSPASGCSLAGRTIHQICCRSGSHSRNSLLEIVRIERMLSVSHSGKTGARTVWPQSSSNPIRLAGASWPGPRMPNVRLLQSGRWCGAATRLAAKSADVILAPGCPSTGTFFDGPIEQIAENLEVSLWGRSPLRIDAPQ